MRSISILCIYEMTNNIKYHIHLPFKHLQWLLNINSINLKTFVANSCNTHFRYMRNYVSSLTKKFNPKKTYLNEILLD